MASYTLVSPFTCVLSHSVVLSSLWPHRLSAEFSQQEHWRGLSFPTPQTLPDPGIEPASLVLPTVAGGFFTGNTTLEVHPQVSH